jgi:photosystem II stability/assembly factor-like uncharacterized protein
MKPLSVFSLILATCFATFSVLGAQEAHWVHIGPGGGTVTSVLEDPSDTNIIYLTTRAQGFWKSEDGGASWERKENGLPIQNINNAAVDASGNGRIYAGTERGVYRSMNGGEAWSIASGGEMDTTGSFLVATDPIMTSRVFAASIGDGVYRSASSGDTWLTVNQGLPPLIWVDITVDPNVNTTLYLSSDAFGMFKSASSGDSWEQKIEGLTNLNLRSFLAAPPFSSGGIYAGTTSGGFFRSSNSGELWTAHGEGLPDADISSLANVGTEGGTILAGTEGEGIFLSVDGGDSFSPTAPPLSAHTVQCLAAPRGEKMYAGMEQDGLFVSRDGGLTWHFSASGLGGATISALAVSSEVPPRLYAAPSGGENDLFSSSDSGITWELSQSGLPASTTVRDLWLAPAPGTVFAATDSGVFMSTDSGLSWEPRNSGFAQSVSRLEGTPLDPNLLYAVSSGIRKSTDMGLTWAISDSGIVGAPLCLLISPTDPDTLYAGTKPAGPEGGGVYKSTDGGESWFAANGGIPALESVFSLDAHPASSSIIFAATGSGIFRSPNAGETWFLRNLGLPLNFLPSDILIDASDPARILASSMTHGVYMTANEAELWSALNDGLDTLYVALLAQYEAAPDSFFAGTVGQGAYVIDFSPTGVKEDSPGGAPLPGDLTLFENFPNPFNPQTTIIVSIGEEETGAQNGRPRKVLLRVYDVRGRLVTTLLDGALTAGIHRFTWDGRDDAGARVASGCYLVAVSSEGQSVTRKMSLIR